MLSTPPAFILSQDQTLMLKVDSRSGLLSLANYPKPSLLGFCSEFSQKSKGLNQTFYFLNFQGFTYCLIFNYQGSLLSCFQQLGYFIITFCACQELFKLFFVAHQQLNQFIMYHCLCQQLFYFSQILYLSHCFHNGTII